MTSADTAEKVPTSADPAPASEPTPVASGAPTPAVSNDPLRGLTLFQKIALFSAPVMLVVMGWGGGTAIHDRLTAQPAPPPPAAPVSGANLYAIHCSSCHGIRGDGRGIAAVNPPARYFGFERFKFATTKNGIPTDADLKNVIRCGIPGSAMPAFPQFTDEESEAIIAHVRNLCWNGAYARFLKKAIKDYDDGGDDPNPLKIATQATEFCKVEAPIPVPATYPPSTPESIARGRKIYLASCVSCHGDKGKGDGPQVKDLKNEDGTPNVPRDLTRGVFKGGGDPHVLYARIRLGIPGTPMPATPTLKDPEMFDLINYVRSLSSGSAAVGGPASVAASTGK